MIHKEGPNWVLYTRDGSRVLGKHKNREGAARQEQAIMASKRHKRQRKTASVDVPKILPHFLDALSGFIK